MRPLTPNLNPRLPPLLLLRVQAKAGITPDIAERLTATSAALSKGRKKRAVAPTVATPDDIAGYSLTGTFPLHATNKVGGWVGCGWVGHAARLCCVVGSVGCGQVARALRVEGG